MLLLFFRGGGKAVVAPLQNVSRRGGVKTYRKEADAEKETLFEKQLRSPYEAPAKLTSFSEETALSSNSLPADPLLKSLASAVVASSLLRLPDTLPFFVQEDEIPEEVFILAFF
jgi:hypothetical protein